MRYGWPCTAGRRSSVISRRCGRTVGANTSRMATTTSANAATTPAGSGSGGRFGQPSMSTQVAAATAPESSGAMVATAARNRGLARFTMLQSVGWPGALQPFAQCNGAVMPVTGMISDLPRWSCCHALRGYAPSHPAGRGVCALTRSDARSIAAATVGRALIVNQGDQTWQVTTTSPGELGVLGHRQPEAPPSWPTSPSH